jgi:hypothetical protein
MLKSYRIPPTRQMHWRNSQVEQTLEMIRTEADWFSPLLATLSKAGQGHPGFLARFRRARSRASYQFLFRYTATRAGAPPAYIPSKSFVRISFHGCA